MEPVSQDGFEASGAFISSIGEMVLKMRLPAGVRYPAAPQQSKGWDVDEPGEHSLT